MKKTIIQQLITDLKSKETKENKEVIKLLQSALDVERIQLKEAFEAGVSYGNSPSQTFDYPASLYLGHTYEQNNEYKLL